MLCLLDSRPLAPPLIPGHHLGTIIHRCFAPYHGTSPVTRDVSLTPPAASLLQEFFSWLVPPPQPEQKAYLLCLFGHVPLVASFSAVPRSPRSLSGRVAEPPRIASSGDFHRIEPCVPSAFPALRYQVNTHCLLPFMGSLDPLLPWHRELDQQC